MKNIIYLCFLLILFSCGNDRGKLDDSNNSEYTDTALSALMSYHKFDSALVVCNYLLEKEPTSHWLLNRKAHILAEIQHYDEAMQVSDKVITQYPDDSECIFLRGIIYQKLGLSQKAIDDFIKLTKNLKKPSRAFNQIGMIFLNQQKFDSSLTYFDKAIQSNPGNSEAYNNRGLAKAGLKMFKESILDFNAALSLRGDLDQAYYNRGVSFYCLSEFESAINDFSKAIMINGDDCRYFESRGGIYLKLNREKEACEDMHKAASLGCQEATKYLQMGYCK